MAEINAKLKLYKRRARLLYIERSMLFGGCAGFMAASVMVLLESKYEWLINYLL